MDADWSVELGADDPTLAVPWASPNGNVRYVDLALDPEAIEQLPEVVSFPELGGVLRSLNGSTSPYRTAKCDVWFDSLMDVNDDPYEAAVKCASYIDLFFTAGRQLAGFAEHEYLARSLVHHLRALADLRSRVEIAIRRCYFRQHSTVEQGLYWTVYVFGYGDEASEARACWKDALNIVTDGLLSVDALGGPSGQA